MYESPIVVYITYMIFKFTCLLFSQNVNLLVGLIIVIEFMGSIQKQEIASFDFY
jgi:hypothetical protein